ncbi:MAG: HAD family hydrolase [Deferribacterales bacterium]
MKFKAVLIDFDNTIIGTEKYNYKLFKDTMGGLIGRELTDDDSRNFEGSTWKGIFETLNTLYLPDMHPDDIRTVFINAKTEFFKTCDAPIADGLDALLGLDIKKGIVTGSSKAEVDMFAHCIDLSGFDVIATDELYDKGKPAPDGYLYAVKALGLNPEECICIEDSQIGLMSAKAAGCTTVFTKEFSHDDYSEIADHTVARMADVLDLL